MNLYLFVFETGLSGDLKLKKNSFEIIWIIKPRPLCNQIVPQSSTKKDAKPNFHHEFSVLGNLGNLGNTGKFL